MLLYIRENEMNPLLKYTIAGIGIFVGFCWGAVLPRASFAARPLLTEDPEPVQKGAVEIEAAFDTFRDGNGDQYYVPLLQAAYGIGERTEIAAGAPYLFLDRHEDSRINGLGDAYAYLKWRAWGEGEKNPALAIKPFVKFPTASEKRGLGSGKADFGLTAVLSKSFPGFNLYFDGTYVRIGEKHVSDEVRVGLAGEIEIIKNLSGVSEIRYGNNFNSISVDDPATFLVGLKAGVGRAIFDAALTLGLNRAAADYLLTMGVTLQFQ